MTGLLVLLWLISLPTVIAGVIKPSLFAKWHINFKSRKQAGLILGGLSVVLFILIGVTAPPSQNSYQGVQGTQTTQTQIEQTTTPPPVLPVVEVATPSPTLPATPAAQNGGQLNSQTQTPGSQNTAGTSITGTTQQTQPVNSGSGLSNDNYYTNSSGNEVHSPAYSDDNSVPSGATAKCKDGTYSFSQHRSGTCSGHGGVAQWL